MSFANDKKGVILERPDLTILDTREMDWEDHLAHPGAKMKVLSRDDDGNPLVVLGWMPPGTTSFNPDGVERHYHTKTREFLFLLSGELAMREYESTEDRQGHRIVEKEGFYVDRRPGSWHGVDHTAPSTVGSTWLEWRDGPLHYQAAGTEDANVIEFLETEE
jgi:tellurite resistance-related uncharacterized protein